MPLSDLESIDLFGNGDFDGSLITVGARDSALSRAQVEEVLKRLSSFHHGVVFQPTWVKSRGDLDLHTSLKTMGKSDFFTKEIDELVLSQRCRVAVHSAKDLPDPIDDRLSVIALTPCISSYDVIVTREEGIKEHGVVGTSSLRREENVFSWCSTLRCIDIRGSIPDRLQLLDRKKVDGVVVAQAALIRLQLMTLPQILLPGKTAPFQGQLAVVALKNDVEMQALFQKISNRPLA